MLCKKGFESIIKGYTSEDLHYIDPVIFHDIVLIANDHFTRYGMGSRLSLECKKRRITSI